MMKKIPYAIANYEQMIKENYYFVDKTKYLVDLESYTVPVFLRPRRFGKTLWCSILECYYDINRIDSFEELFGETYIGKNPTQERNKYLTIRFNFSTIRVTGKLNEIEKSFNEECGNEINSFLNQYGKKYLKGLKLDSDKASTNISKILNFIKDNNLPQMFIIIDEYDNFSNQLILSHNDKMYQDLTTGDSFFKSFFKVIKAGTEKSAIRRVYITGVLPITMDDLTSGFNIAEVITLKKQFVSMLGFNQAEVDEYVNYIFIQHNFDKANIEAIKVMLKTYYNGYQFMLDSEKLYNSTILSYFLKNFTLDGGEIPLEFIDDNLKTDVNWIKRLTIHESNTKEMLEKLLFDGELNYDQNMISSKFNMNQFFEKDFYPVSLFYLGMITFKDRYSMGFPNQTMKKIFADYFNIVENIEVSKGYTDYFRQFDKDQDLEKLFAGYWKTYVGQIPAQAFDKANENFFRTTFYELCTRYLSHHFVFNIEVNYPSGRSDWELLGKYHTEFKNLKYLVEFKHFSKLEAKRLEIAKIKEPLKEDIEQVTDYANDILTTFPDYNITKFIIYTISAEKFRFFKLQ